MSEVKELLVEEGLTELKVYPSPRNTFLTNLANLLKVKSIITILLVGTFMFCVAYSMIKQVPMLSEITTVVGTVIGYFFGTKNPEKKE